MKFELYVNMDNDAFENSIELGHILTNVADKVSDYHFLTGELPTGQVILDSNGNKVGNWVVTA
jgi:hypothetical protein